MAFSRKYSAPDINGCLLSAADKLGIDDFRPQQRAALEAYLQGQDVFVNLPTGFGKSAIFQAAPFCMDFLLQKSCYSIAIVVSPLAALMKDQIESLTSRGIRAASLTTDTPPATRSAINKGHFSLVFASPETLSKSGRALLCNDVYREQLCGIFIDESHCIKKWGFGEGKLKAFRKEYSHLGELRSYISRNIPVVALTATATSSTRATIIQSLGLQYPASVLKTPRRDNIKYVVVKTKERDIVKTLQWKLDDLKLNGAAAERLIVYCRSKAQCNRLYAHFEHLLRPPSQDDRTFAKFHAQTDGDVKDYILTHFKNDASHLRVLFATVAFGMGVDVRDIHTIVHYGPPHDIEEFVQESGRGGRDGQPSVSILVNWPGSGVITRPNEDMRLFVSTTVCRRATAFSLFDGDDGSSGNHHTCCDNCEKSCTCGDETCGKKSNAERAFSAQELVAHLPNRIVNQELRTVVEEKLIAYRDELLTEVGDGDRDRHYLAGGDITTGFPLSTCKKVAAECHLLLSREQFSERYAFYKKTAEDRVYEIVYSTLEQCELESGSESNDSESLDTTDCASSSSEIQRPDLFSSTTDSD